MNNQQQQPKVDAGVGKMPSNEELVTATQMLHQQLHDCRQKIMSLYELFLRTSAAYYTMCDLGSEDASLNGPELLLAMAEFHRRGFIQLSDKAIEQLSKDYVQSLKMLKQAVDNATTICDRLAVMTNVQRVAQQTTLAAQPPSNTPQPVFQSLDEALEAEINAENE